MTSERRDGVLVEPAAAIPIFASIPPFLEQLHCCSRKMAATLFLY